MMMQKSDANKEPIRLEVVRPMFFKGKRLEIGETFEVLPEQAADMLVTMRAKFANEADRGAVYRIVEVF